jgi:hypothetical protein
MPDFDVSVVGELNLDMILGGLPAALERDREYLATDFTVTLGSSSAISPTIWPAWAAPSASAPRLATTRSAMMCLQRLGSCGANLSGVRKFQQQQTGVTVILPNGAKRYILTYPGNDDGYEFTKTSTWITYFARSISTCLRTFFIGPCDENRYAVSQSETGRPQHFLGYQR